MLMRQWSNLIWPAMKFKFSRLCRCNRSSAGQRVPLDLSRDTNCFSLRACASTRSADDLRWQCRDPRAQRQSDADRAELCRSGSAALLNALPGQKSGLARDDQKQQHPSNA